MPRPTHDNLHRGSGWFIATAVVVWLMLYFAAGAALGQETCPAEAVAVRGPQALADYLILSPDLMYRRAVVEWADEARDRFGRDCFVFVCHAGPATRPDGRPEWHCYPLAAYPWGRGLHFPVRWPARLLRAMLPADRGLLLVCCNETGLPLGDRPLPGVYYSRGGRVWLVPGADTRHRLVLVPVLVEEHGVGGAKGFEEAK